MFDIEKGRFTWIDECESVFQELKHQLTSAPVLTIPDGNISFGVYLDDSRRGLGCVIMQHWEVVAYSSIQLKKIMRKTILNTT